MGYSGVVTLLGMLGMNCLLGHPVQEGEGRGRDDSSRSDWLAGAMVGGACVCSFFCDWPGIEKGVGPISMWMQCTRVSTFFFLPEVDEKLWKWNESCLEIAPHKRRETRLTSSEMEFMWSFIQKWKWIWHETGFIRSRTSLSWNRWLLQFTVFRKKVILCTEKKNPCPVSSLSLLSSFFTFLFFTSFPFFVFVFISSPPPPSPLPSPPPTPPLSLPPPFLFLLLLSPFLENIFFLSHCPKRFESVTKRTGCLSNGFKRETYFFFGGNFEPSEGRLPARHLCASFSWRETLPKIGGGDGGGDGLVVVVVEMDW